MLIGYSEKRQTTYIETVNWYRYYSVFIMHTTNEAEFGETSFSENFVRFHSGTQEVSDGRYSQLTVNTCKLLIEMGALE